MCTPLKHASLILALSVFLLPWALSAEDWPTLRQTNYVALLGSAGQEMTLQLRSEQRAPQYPEELRYKLVGSDSNELAAGEVALGKSKTITATPRKDGLCILELEAGWNVCYFDSGDTPSAFVASGTSPLHIIREIPQLYFHVPVNCDEFHVHLISDVTGEGARIRIFTPDKALQKEEEGDYDRAESLKLEVPFAAHGGVWSLAILKPTKPGLALDDVTLWLGARVPPYLSTREDWARTFGESQRE